MKKLLIAINVSVCLLASVAWGYEGNHNDGALLEEWERLVGEPRSIFDPLPSTGLEHWPSDDDQWDGHEDESFGCYSFRLSDGSVLTMCDEE